MAGFFTAPRIAWGIGAIEQLSSLGARKALFVVDPAIESQEGPHRVREELVKSETRVELVRAPDRPDSTAGVESIADRIRSALPEWIVVVGGGRTIDAAKAARVRFARPDVALDALTPLVEVPEPSPTRLVAIPSTSGSGSEATGSADLWAEDGAPYEVAHRSMTADWALLDPSFARSLPTELVVDGALETAVQAFEAYVSAWASPFSDAFAIDALATVLERLPHALRWGEDPDARAALHYAATAAGLAVANAQRGVAHALARSLAGPTGLSYGRLLGLLFPAVLDFDHPSARDRVESLGVAVAREEDDRRGPLPVRWSRLVESARFPTSLSAAGVDPTVVRAARPAIVAQTLRSPAVLANPRVPTPADVGHLLDRLVGGS